MTNLNYNLKKKCVHVHKCLIINKYKYVHHIKNAKQNYRHKSVINCHRKSCFVLYELHPYWWISLIYSHSILKNLYSKLWGIITCEKMSTWYKFWKKLAVLQSKVLAFISIKTRNRFQNQIQQNIGK